MLSMDRPIPTSFPKQNYTEIRRLIKKLKDGIHTYDIFGNEIAGKPLTDFVDLISMELSRKESLAESARPAILASVTDIAGKIATKDLIHPWIERFAHNAERIKRGQPVGGWNPEGYIGWCVSEFRDMEYIKKGDEKRIRFRMRTFSGLAYGIDYFREYVTNHPSLDVLLYKLGAAGKGSTSSPRELIQLRCWIELRSRRNELFMQRWTIDEQLKRYNSKIVKERRKPCHAGYKWACAKCPMGYDGPDNCVLGCRSETNKEKYYELCQRPKLPKLQEGQRLQHQGNATECSSVNPPSSQSSLDPKCS
jgi:hypothetical protein